MIKTVLIVEDDPTSMIYTADLLEAWGYDTLRATDGAQGVAAAKKYKPDLILMDIMMPVMDGYAACNAIKTTPGISDIPMIMLTAVGYELNKLLASQLGASGFVTKPFKGDQLRVAINQVQTTT